MLLLENNNKIAEAIKLLSEAKDDKFFSYSNENFLHFELLIEEIEKFKRSLENAEYVAE